MFAKRILLMVGLLSVLLAACSTQEARPSRLPKYSQGTRVEIASESPSLSLYSDCSSRMARLVGLANAGDAATVLERKSCSGGWWYQIQVAALRDTDWEGVGWVPEENLKIR